MTTEPEYIEIDKATFDLIVSELNATRRKELIYEVTK